MVGLPLPFMGGGVSMKLDIYQTLSLMIAFGMLIAYIVVSCVK